MVTHAYACTTTSQAWRMSSGSCSLGLTHATDTHTHTSTPQHQRHTYPYTTAHPVFSRVALDTGPNHLSCSPPHFLSLVFSFSSVLPLVSIKTTPQKKKIYERISSLSLSLSLSVCVCVCVAHTHCDTLGHTLILTHCLQFSSTRQVDLGRNERARTPDAYGRRTS